MMVRRLAPIIVVGLGLLATPVLADPGDSLHVGSLGSPATFVDNNTGVTYNFILTAVEGPGGGQGSTTLFLNDGSLTSPSVPNPSLSVCTVHGPEAAVFPNPESNVFPPFVGNNPLVAIQCGTAGDQSVSIQACVADVEAHGFVHSDHPNVAYLGTMTVDVRYQKKAGPDTIQVVVHTPKEKIQLLGQVTAGAVSISSCP